MGSILECRRPEWAIEVRRESWHLTAAGFVEWKYGGGDEPTAGLMATAQPPTFSVPRSQLGSLARVVGQVMKHQQLMPHQGPQDVWTPHEQNERVTLQGPVITYGVRELPELCQSVEIEYTHTPALLLALQVAGGVLLAIDADCPACGWAERSFEPMRGVFGCPKCAYESEEREA